MTDSESPSDSVTPFEAAAGWVARRSRTDWSVRDEHRFQAWLAADADHRSAYDEAQSLYADMGRSVAIGSVPRPATAPSAGSTRRWLAASVAAVVLIGAAAGWLGRTSPVVARKPVTYSTHVGAIHKVQLSDGSGVTLDADSRLDWTAGDVQRDATLVQGRAVFDVASDPTRPFVIHAGKATIRVTGTMFSVDRRESGVEVSVAEGAVAVAASDGTGAAPNGGQVTLRPGQRAMVAGTIAVELTDPADFAAWRSGRLVFHSRPLREVAREIERYFQGRVEIRGESIGDFRLSGSFDRHRLNALLAALEDVMPVRVRRPDSRLIVIEPKE